MPLDFLAHLERDAARFSDVLTSTDAQAPVPSCPDWTADDLFWHLAEVFLFWGTIVRDRLDDPADAERRKPARPAHRDELRALYRTATDDLLATLRETPGETTVWTWSDDQSAGFVRRRMAHEALIHRLDAELITGDVTDIEADLAADGAHEALQHFYGGYPPWSTHRTDGPVGRLRSADTGDEWLFQLGSFSGLSPNSGKTYDDEPALELIESGEPTFTLAGNARDLDVWLWNRPTRTEPVLDGDRADFAAFEAIITAGIE